jgi:hypothetical protein
MRKFLLLLFITTVSAGINAQCTILANAVVGITLTHQNTNCSNNSGVAWNPNQSLYYACRAGNSAFPYETWSSTGTPLFNTLTGYDFRGLWWNPTTNGLEGNGFNSMGIWQTNLNGSFYATSTGAVVLAMGQPNSQSCGDLDPTAYEVLYYNAGTISRYSRTTGAFLGSYAISGTPVPVGNLNSTTVMYTGCAGMEIALLDYINKRVYMYNKATGAYVGMSQLPPTGATASASFKTSWANNYVWLFELSTFTWYSYQVLSIGLPIELISFEGKCERGKAELNWKCSLNCKNNDFIVERSVDGINFVKAGEVKVKAKGSSQVSYAFSDEITSSEETYYRLRQTDQAGVSDLSEVIGVNCGNKRSELTIFPNPGKGNFILKGAELNSELTVTNSLGQTVYRSIVTSEVPQEIRLIDLPSGIYYVQTTSSLGKSCEKLILD